MISDALCPDIGQAPQAHEGSTLKERQQVSHLFGLRAAAKCWLARQGAVETGPNYDLTDSGRDHDSVYGS